LGLLDVDARNVVYMYQPTATAITIIIASNIASSIDVRPFIGVEHLLNYKFALRRGGLTEAGLGVQGRSRRAALV
jgi:hypothetical protein